MIKVFEYSKLKVGENGFEENHFRQLIKMNERNNYKYFSVGHKSISLFQYVGVIQVGNLTIEILPKADKNSSDVKKWQNAFLIMLKESRLLEANIPGYADLKLRSASLLEIFLETYINEVQKIYRTGIVKKYRKVEENSNSLKGKLNFDKNIQHNLIHKERFYNTFQVYDRNNIFNQILLKALRTLMYTNLSSTLRSKLLELLFAYEGIEEINITEDTFLNLKYDRRTEGYRKAIDLARLILLNYSPDIQAGKDNIISLLFDMNEVFEKFIYYRVKKASNYLPMKVKAQNRKYFWENKTIRPDLVIEYEDDNSGENKRAIIDTKWKVLDKINPSDSDLKQIFTYNLHFGAKKGVLLYPNVYDLKPIEGFYMPSIAVKDDYSGHSCYPYFVELFDDNGSINKNIGEKILNDVLDL